MPEICSFRYVFMRAVFTRISRKASRMRRRVQLTPIATTGGTAAKAMSESCQSSESITTTMPRSRMQIAESVERARREHLVDRVDVVGDARDEPADGRLVEEPELARVEELEDVQAQIAHRARPCELHQVHLRERDDLLHHEQAGQDHPGARERGLAARRLDRVEARRS
jgi:hypothetical protein